MNATLPAMCAELTSAVQPSEAGAVPSSTSTTFPVTPAVVTALPKPAVPATYVPAMAVGEFTTTIVRGPRTSGDASVT